MINLVRCTDAGFGFLVKSVGEGRGQAGRSCRASCINTVLCVLVPPSPTLHFTAAFFVVCGSCLLPVECSRGTASLLRTASLFLRQDSQTRASVASCCEHVLPSALQLSFLGGHVDPTHLLFSLCFGPISSSPCASRLSSPCVISSSGASLLLLVLRARDLAWRSIKCEADDTRAACNALAFGRLCCVEPSSSWTLLCRLV